MHNVPAVVAQPGALHDNLLGQTFLMRLRDFKMEGDRVILHAE
jgi:predicted aspartyl protease